MSKSQALEKIEQIATCDFSDLRVERDDLRSKLEEAEAKLSAYRACENCACRIVDDEQVRECGWHRDRRVALEQKLAEATKVMLDVRQFLAEDMEACARQLLDNQLGL